MFVPLSDRAARAILLSRAAFIPRSLAHRQRRPLKHPRMSATDSSGLYTLGDSFLAFYARKAQPGGADRPAAATHAAAAAATAVPPTSAPLQLKQLHASVMMNEQQAPVSGGGTEAPLSSTAQVSATQLQQPLVDGGAAQLAAVTQSSSNGDVRPSASEFIPTGELAASAHNQADELNRSTPVAALPLSEASGAAAHSTAATASGNGSNGAQLPSAQFASSQVSYARD